MPDQDPKRIQVTPANALILLVGLTNNVVEQNKAIIRLLGEINMKLTKPAIDLGGADGQPNKQ